MKRNLSILIFIAYTTLIAYVSLTPYPSAQVGSYDKLAHLAAYVIFALVAMVLGLSRRHYYVVCIAIIGYGGLLEVAQSFIPGRQMSALDLLANTLGVLLGAMSAHSVSASIRRTGLK